jgi:ABC-type Mn2+/Zn2+ transport system permease subunit
MLVAVASVMGLVGWIAAARRRPVVADWIALAASIAIAVGSLLAFGNPPSFTKPSVGPWVSLAGAVVAGSAAMVAVRRSAAVE